MKKNRKGNNEEKKNKKSFNMIEVVIIMIITCFFGIFMGSLITFISVKTTPQVEYDNNNDDKYITKFKESYDNIVSNYYDKIDKQELIDSAIKGMVDYLDDPYANYMDKDDSTDFSENIEGEYVGIGGEITIDSENKAVISKVFKSSPAEKAGLKVGDIVLKIDNEDITDEDDFSKLKQIKGKENTKVVLKIKRDNKEQDITLVRKKVEIESIESKIEKKNNKKIGIIKINIFAANTDKQFKKHLSQLEKEEIDSLIIDVRNNSGGYLSTVTNIASQFLEKNKIIYQLSSKEIKEPVLDKTKEKRTYNVVVLINESSASASEILAAALKESYKATIVGTKSFGKGAVQKAYYLSNGTSYKYTIQKWLTPSGKNIDKKGITPDIEESDENKQLERAIEVLVK